MAALFAAAGLGLVLLAAFHRGPHMQLLALAGTGLVAGGVLCLARRTIAGLAFLAMGLACALAAGVAGESNRRDLAAPVALSLVGLWLIWSQRLRKFDAPDTPTAPQDPADGP
jgi:hypothetical protein